MFVGTTVVEFSSVLGQMELITKMSFQLICQSYVIKRCRQFQVSTKTKKLGRIRCPRNVWMSCSCLDNFTGLGTRRLCKLMFHLLGQIWQSGHAAIQTDLPPICFGLGQSQPFIWNGAGFDTPKISRLIHTFFHPSHVLLLWLVRSVRLQCIQSHFVFHLWITPL